MVELSFLVKFPRYLLQSFLLEWLSIENLVSLDCAIVDRKSRSKFTLHLYQLCFKVKDVRDWQCCFEWFRTRNCFICELRLYNGVAADVNVTPSFEKLKSLSLSNNDLGIFQSLFLHEWPCLESLKVKCIGNPTIDRRIVVHLPKTLKSVRMHKFLCWFPDALVASMFSNVCLLEHLLIYQPVVLSRLVLSYVLQSTNNLRIAVFDGFEFFNGQNLLEELEVRSPLLEDLTVHTSMRNIPEEELFEKFEALRHLLLQDKGYSVEYTTAT